MIFGVFSSEGPPHLFPHRSLRVNADAETLETTFKPWKGPCRPLTVPSALTLRTQDWIAEYSNDHVTPPKFTASSP